LKIISAPFIKFFVLAVIEFEISSRGYELYNLYTLKIKPFVGENLFINSKNQFEGVQKNRRISEYIFQSSI